jgi:aminotransferase
MDNAISLGIGEPDFVTPWHIRDAGIFSLEKGFTKYTGNAGLTRLRMEIAAYLKRRFDLDYNYLNQIIVTVGGSVALDLAIRALVNPARRLSYPSRRSCCYGPITELASARPSHRDKGGKRVPPDAGRAARGDHPVNEAARPAVPQQPTGGIMERADVEALAEVLCGTDIMVVSVEIYAELTYGSAISRWPTSRT